MNAQTKLAKAKTSLVLDHPFFGTLALNMPAHIHPSQWFEERNMPPTAAVSYDDMHFCEDFIEELTDSELMFVVAHEVMHPALEHPSRVQSRDRYDWNVAGDYVINQLLTDSRVGSMPKDGLLDKNIYNSGEGVTDKIYNIVHNDKQDGDGEGQGKPLDTIMESEGGTPAEAEAKASEWKVKIVQAAQAAKMMGKLPSSVERLVGEVTQPKIRLQDVLFNFLVRSRDDDRSYARPNRRFSWHDMILPSVSGEALGELVFALDCSGSIGQAEINQFAAELSYIQQELRFNKLHVIYFDSEVSHYESYERGDSLNIRPHGGGGTAFSPVFDYITEHDITPVACVFLTDLYCSDFGNEPDYPVLWVSNGSNEAPFGEIITWK